MYEGEDFEKYSFLEQDIKIVVGGIKANEIFLLEKVLKDRSYKMYYILNLKQAFLLAQDKKIN